MPKELITAEEARQLFHYNPETGDLTWAVSPNNRIPVGYVVRAVDAHGYYRVKINNRKYRAHRIAWLITHGKWPNEHLDHINGDKRDNRLCNLREATNAENCRNSGIRRTNSSGYKGVYRQESYKKWRAQITVDYKIHYLGVFNTPEEAHAAYCKAAKELHGEFANTG